MNAPHALFQVGAQFEMSACLFEVAYVGRDALRIAPVNGGLSRTMSLKGVMEMINHGDAKITYLPLGAHSGSRAALNDQQIEALNRKLRYVEGVAARVDKPGSKRQIAPTIQEVAAEIGDPAPPSASSVAHWVSTWLKNGRHEAALMPKPRPSRRRFEEDAPLERIITRSIEEVYLHSQKNPATAVHAAVQCGVHEYNAAHPGERLRVPSIDSVRRRVKRIDKYQRDAARHGKLFARRAHRAAGIGFFTTEPLELVMADGQMLDVIIVESTTEGGQPKDIGRPFLTLMIDVYSRCILGAFVSLAPFCGGTLLRTLRNVVTPCGEEPRGIPGKLIVDNGSDYIDSGFVRACERLGITLEYSPPRMPNRKAHVERFFRTLNEQLIHKLPGTTFSNPTDRGDYKSQEMARLTLEELREKLETFIRHHYHVTEHRGLGRMPIAVWKEAVAEKPVRTISEKEAELLARSSCEREVVKGCVQVHDLRWGSDALATWESEEREAGRTPTVEVRLDELDLSFALVLPAGRTEPQFKAHARQPRYVHQLSLYEHRLLKAALKAQAIHERMVEQADEKLHRLRIDYYAALGHANDKVAAARRERLHDSFRELESQQLRDQLKANAEHAAPVPSQTPEHVESNAEAPAPEHPAQLADPGPATQPPPDVDDTVTKAVEPGDAAESTPPRQPPGTAPSKRQPRLTRTAIRRRPR